MVAKLTCLLLLLLALCKAEEIDSVDLKSEIDQAKQKVKGLNQSSTRDVADANGFLIETITYVRNTKPIYQSNAVSLVKEAILEITNLSNKYFGDAIDKNKPVNTFTCLLKAAEETENSIEDSLKKSSNCINTTCERAVNELTSLTSQLRFIKQATLGLYDSILNKLGECSTSREVSELMLKADIREKNLKKLLGNYMGRGSDLRIQYNEGELNCLSAARTNVQNMIKACENKMKTC